MDDCIFVWYVDFFLKFAHGVNEYMLIIEESMKSQQKVNTYFLIISFFDLPKIRSMPPSLLMVYIGLCPCHCVLYPLDLLVKLKAALSMTITSQIVHHIL